MIKAVVDKFVSLCISDEQPCSEWDINELNQILLPVVPLKKIELTDEELSKRIKKDNLLERLQKEAIELYEAKEKEFPEEEQIRELERVVLLKVIDRKWMDHIDDMDQLRQGIGLQAYGNKDPKVEYRISGFDMFDEMTASIQEDTVKMLLHVQVQQKVEREQVAKVTGTNKDDSLAKAPVKREDKKVYPNDPCPCGSGKKFKQCCQKKI
jgi:preprotein translocase subunit SecA